jgi:hypothetical protein
MKFLPISALLLVILLLISCGQQAYPCPREPALRLGWKTGTDYFERYHQLRDQRLDPAHPYLHEAVDRHLRVTSESTVELVYERDGQVVVETYVVTGTVVRADDL